MISIPDVNVLVCAVAEQSPLHRPCNEWLNSALNGVNAHSRHRIERFQPRKFLEVAVARNDFAIVVEDGCITRILPDIRAPEFFYG